MKSCLTVSLLLLVVAFPAGASPPIGVYGVVDKVVFEPSETSPQRMQIWGVFASSVDGGTDHDAPAYGYFYFQMDSSRPERARQEWADLKKLAGTGQCVAFAGREDGRPKPRLRKPGEEPRNPDTYPVALGLFRLRETNAVADTLRSLPIPAAPMDGARVEAGAVTLSVRNILSKEHPKARYVFEIENGAGQEEKSEPLVAGDQETRWTPRMKLKAGEKYTWRAWATQENWKGPVATAHITGKLAP